MTHRSRDDPAPFWDGPYTTYSAASVLGTTVAAPSAGAYVSYQPPTYMYPKEVGTTTVEVIEQGPAYGRRPLASSTVRSHSSPLEVTGGPSPQVHLSPVRLYGSPRRSRSTSPRGRGWSRPETVQTWTGAVTTRRASSGSQTSQASRPSRSSSVGSSTRLERCYGAVQCCGAMWRGVTRRGVACRTGKWWRVVCGGVPCGSGA